MRSPIRGRCERCGGTGDSGIVYRYPCCERLYCCEDCHRESYHAEQNVCEHGDPCCELCHQRKRLTVAP